VEWVWRVILMTNEDKEDCLTVLKTMKETCAVFAKYRKADDPIIAAFIYGMNESADVLIEIIENKPLEIKRMF
jgi:hypothetical protein